jgi:hypothetical protein
MTVRLHRRRNESESLSNGLCIAFRIADKDICSHPGNSIQKRIIERLQDSRTDIDKFHQTAMFIGWQNPKGKKKIIPSQRKTPPANTNNNFGRRPEYAQTLGLYENNGQRRIDVVPITEDGKETTGRGYLQERVGVSEGRRQELGHGEPPDCHAGRDGRLEKGGRSRTGLKGSKRAILQPGQLISGMMDPG